MQSDLSGFGFSSAQRVLLRNALETGFGLWSGVRLLEARPGFARLTFAPRAEMLTPWNTLNGGILNALIEIPAFVALLTELAGDELPVTNDIFLQHVRPLPGALEYELVGNLLRKGKTMAWAEATALVAGKACTYARVTKTLTGLPAAH